MNEISLTFFRACTTCKCIKPLTTEFFGKQTRGWKGFFGICKRCKSIVTSRRRIENIEEALIREAWQRKNNPESKRAASKRYKEANREKTKASTKTYYEANKEEKAVYSARWRLENKDRHREMIREWKKNNPDKVEDSTRRRRAAKYSADRERYTAADLNAMWHAQGGCCFYCQTLLFVAYHIEHRTPLSRGGADALANVVLACQPCNSRKCAKTAEEFFKVLENDTRKGGRFDLA